VPRLVFRAWDGLYRIRSPRFRIAAQKPSRILRSPRDGHQLDEPADRLRVQLDVPRCGPRPTAPSGRRIACQNAVIMSSRSCLTQSRGNAVFCRRSRSGTGSRHPRRCRGWLSSATPYAASSSGSCSRRRYAFIHSITGVSQALSSLAAGKLSASEIVDLDLELGSRNSGATAHRK
jgi:hypothetical protein